MIVQGFTICAAGRSRAGKASLIKAITGSNPAAPPAEGKKNGGDLRFAPLYLPSGIRVDIVDIPGEGRYKDTAVAGLTGADMLLLTVSAKKGIDVSIREYIDIARLLNIAPVVAAVVRKSTAPTKQEKELERKIERVLSKGGFPDAPVVGVSIGNKAGLGRLVTAIEEEADKVRARPADFPTRLPIDNSFILPGAGRVVTGTLWSGVITSETELELLPPVETCLLRRIEAQEQPVTKALPGQRVSLSVVVYGRPPKRGDWLVPAGSINMASEMIVEVRLLPEADRALKGKTDIRLYHGTARYYAELVPLGRKQIEPGGSGFAKLLCDEKVPAVFRDRVLIADRSGQSIFAGGAVIEAPARRGRRKNVVRVYKTLASGEDDKVVFELLRQTPAPLTAEDIAGIAQIGQSAAERAIGKLLADGVLVSMDAFRRVFYVSAEQLVKAGDLLRGRLAQDRSDPGEGAVKDKVRLDVWPTLSSSQADILFNYFVKECLIEKKDGRLLSADRLDADPRRESAAALYKLIEGFAPPSLTEMAAAAGLTETETNRALEFLSQERRIREIKDGIYFSTESLEEICAVVTEYLLEAGAITEDRFSELLGIDPATAAALIEYLNKRKITRRQGNELILYR